MWEAKRDIAHGDLVAFGLDSNLLVHNAVELLLKLNGGYLHQPREIRAILEKTDPKFISFLTSFFVAVKSSERVTLLEKLADYSSQKAGGPLPKNWKV
jgi:Na+/H+ antiporter NhaD/arsenite permease-like protein